MCLDLYHLPISVVVTVLLWPIQATNGSAELASVSLYEPAPPTPGEDASAEQLQHSVSSQHKMGQNDCIPLLVRT